MIDVLRTEQKYPITYLEYKQLCSILDGCMHQDSHNGFDGYLVRSLYFDTPDDRDYMDKLGGFEVRRKVRLRTYNPEEDYVIKLELKEKQGDLQRKRSLMMKKEDAEALCGGAVDVLQGYEGDFAKEMYLLMKENNYIPKCVVEYERKAYTMPENDIRITFDSNIKANEAAVHLFNPDSECYPVADYGAVTMEVKFNNFLFSYIKDMISLSGRMQVSTSKYCLGRMATIGIEV